MKQRLMDADKYCEFLNTYPLEKAQSNFMAFYRDALQHTFECEVDAIPIEYIKKELKKLDSNINYARYVGDEMLDQLIYAKSWVEEVLLKGWEKENGKIPQRDKVD